MLLSLVLATAPSPTPTPSNGGLKPGLSFEQVTPGTLGFLATFALAVAGLLLIRSMNKRLRRIRHRAMLEERAATERGEGDAGGGPGPGDDPDVGPGRGPADGDAGHDTGPVAGQPGRTRP